MLGRTDKVNKAMPSSIKVSSDIFCKKRDMGIAVNKFLTSLALELDSKLPLLDSKSSEADLPYKSSSIILSPVNTSECCDIIAKLKPSPQGMNRGSENLLKSLRDINCEPITELINYSFGMRFFPKSLNFTCVEPFFKGRNELELNNYRPISLIPIVGKIIKNILIDIQFYPLVNSESPLGKFVMMP